MIDEFDPEKLAKGLVAFGLVLLPLALIIFLIAWIKKLLGGLNPLSSESGAGATLILIFSAALSHFVYRAKYEWAWFGRFRANPDRLERGLRKFPKLLFVLFVFGLIQIVLNH